MFFNDAIGMGEIGVGRESGTLRTFVGSCVAVALYDRRRKIAGMAHVMVPDSRGLGGQPGRFADTAVPEILRRLAELCRGESPRCLAKLAGGAKMFTFQTGIPIGEQNVMMIERILEQLDIPIVANCCGGEQGRRVSLDVATGMMTVETLGAEPIRL